MSGYNDIRQMAIDASKLPLVTYRVVVGIPSVGRKLAVRSTDGFFLKINGVRLSVNSRPRILPTVEGGEHDARVEAIAQVDVWVNSRHEEEIRVDVAELFA